MSTKAQKLLPDRPAVEITVKQQRIPANICIHNTIYQWNSAVMVAENVPMLTGVQIVQNKDTSKHLVVV